MTAPGSNPTYDICPDCEGKEMHCGTCKGTGKVCDGPEDSSTQPASTGAATLDRYALENAISRVNGYYFPSAIDEISKSGLNRAFERAKAETLKHMRTAAEETERLSAAMFFESRKWPFDSSAHNDRTRPLVEALVKYGCHVHAPGPMCERAKHSNYPCTCGLDAALKAATGADHA